MTTPNLSNTADAALTAGALKVLQGNVASLNGVTAKITVKPVYSGTTLTDAKYHSI